MVSSTTSSLSAKFLELLPHGELSEPARTLPLSIQIECNDKQDEATLVVSPSVSVSNENVVSQLQMTIHGQTPNMPTQARVKHAFPKELISIDERNLLGQRIFATVLMEANVKRYDSSFKYGKKLQLLTNVYLTCFVNGFFFELVSITLFTTSYIKCINIILTIMRSIP